MGTNYYLQLKGRKGRIHIGKSSFGWAFALHCHYGVVETMFQWKKLINEPGNKIVDEYGRKIRPVTMLHIIEKRGSKTKANDFGLQKDYIPLHADEVAYDKKLRLLRHTEPMVNEDIVNPKGKTYDIITTKPEETGW